MGSLEIIYLVISVVFLFVCAFCSRKYVSPLCLPASALLKPSPHSARSESLSLYGRAIEAITSLLHPLVIVLSWTAESIARMVHSSTMPRALISTIISIGEGEGVVDEASAKMLHKGGSK